MTMMEFAAVLLLIAAYWLGGKLLYAAYHKWRRW